MRNGVSNYLKLAGFAGALAIGSLMLAAPAQAGKYSNPTAALQHYVDCANWLISDPAKHAANCNPGHTFFVSASTGSGSVGSGGGDDGCCHCCGDEVWTYIPK